MMSKHAPRSANPVDVHVGSRVRLRRQVMKMSQERLGCLLYTSPSPRDQRGSRMPSSA